MKKVYFDTNIIGYSIGTQEIQCNSNKTGGFGGK